MAAAVATHGPFDFFITMTASPDWQEIIDFATKLNFDREDLVNQVDIPCRVFYQKMLEFRNTLAHDFFGRRENMQFLFSTIEFQKRIMPHIHIALKSWISQDSMLRRIDLVVCCELPDEDSELKHHVERLMIHKCGERCRKRSGRPRTWKLALFSFLFSSHTSLL